MNFVYQCKVVGLTYHKVQNAVEQGDYVILVANTENPVDSDCIEVYNAERELVGYIANSDKTLSQNNRKNGNISASELKENLDFTGKEFYGEVIKAFSSCLYLEVNEGKWSYINKPVDEGLDLTFKRAIDLLEPEVVEVPVDVIEPIREEVKLAAEITELKSMVAELLAEVKALKTAINEGDNSPSKPSPDRMLLSVVGLSHFQGQDHMDGVLTITEEPIFEGAKGTALYLKSGDYRVGVFPSEKKKAYCEEHGIPYVEGNSLKGKTFEGNVMIEEIVYNEYCVISV